MKKISFKVDGQNLVGTILYPQKLKETNPAILFLHGWTSSEKGYIKRSLPLVELGYICMTFSLRGHGESEGDLDTLSRQDHLKDCKTAYDVLSSQKGIDQENISIIGSSYGGYLGSLLVSERRVKNLVLKAPALYPDIGYKVPTKKLIANDNSIFNQQYPLWKLNMALNSLHRFEGNVLIIECGNDEEILKTTIQSFRNSVNPLSKTDYQVIPNADHGLTNENWNQEFIQILKEWFSP